MVTVPFAVMLIPPVVLASETTRMPLPPADVTGPEVVSTTAPALF